MRKAPALSLPCYNAQQRWQLDSLEYADSLSESEREWLGRFLQAHYHGRRSGIQPLELQRKSDVSRRRNDDDALSRAAVPGVTARALSLQRGDQAARRGVGSGAALEFNALAVADAPHPESQRVQALDAEATAALRARLRAVRAEAGRGCVFRARVRRERLEAAQGGVHRHREA